MNDFGDAPEKRNPMPFGVLFRFGPFAPPRFGRRQREIDDRRAVGQVPQFGIAPQIADENHFVDAAFSCHFIVFSDRM